MQPTGCFVLTVIVVAVISICFGFSIVMQEDINNIVFFFSLISILLLNFIIFYLYDSIVKALNEKMQNEIINHKIEYYKKQAELIQKNSDDVKQLRHDMKNHMIVIEELAVANDSQSIRATVEKYNGEISIEHSENEFIVRTILPV